MKQYLELLDKIVKNGNIKENRTGINTISLFSEHFKHRMAHGFPILTTKFISWQNIVLEMLFFLGGGSNFFKKHNVKFWDPWRDSSGNLPWSYEHSWREFPIGSQTFEIEDCETGEIRKSINTDAKFDQITRIINELKNNPNNRRLVLNRWDVRDAWSSHLPPCFYASIFNVQNINGEPNLNLANVGRSVDVMIGAPYNLAGFSLLLSLISHIVGIKAGEISFFMVDCHLYANHISAAHEQLGRMPKTLPKVVISDKIKNLKDIDDLILDSTKEEIMECFKLIGYFPDTAIKIDVAI